MDPDICRKYWQISSTFFNTRRLPSSTITRKYFCSIWSILNSVFYPFIACVPSNLLRYQVAIELNIEIQSKSEQNQLIKCIYVFVYLCAICLCICVQHLKVALLCPDMTSLPLLLLFASSLHCFLNHSLFLPTKSLY